jgi:cytochrome c
VTRPADTRLFAGAHTQLVKEGERLWNDPSLGTSGLACGTCHLNHGHFNPSFTNPFPHPVAMTEQRAGLKQVRLDEMVQFCMVVPMASKPLAWDSEALAALTAYAGQVQKEFIKAAAANPCNPCVAKHPCAAKNPCTGNR